MKSKNKIILVTGGAGFIGSYVNKCLSESGYDTVVIDNLSRGSRQSVCAGDFVLGDLADKNTLCNLFKKHQFDAVMHFAAYIDVGESVRNPALYYRNNVINSLNLLEVMSEHHVHSLIYSSSAAVYGNPIQRKINENHPQNPINPYGENKSMVEKILSHFDHSYGLRSCSLRYFNAAGGDPAGKLKHPQKNNRNLIPILLRSLSDKGTPITIYGDDYPTHDGTCIRDYIHIDDLAKAHISSLEYLLAGGKTTCYNLGNGQGYSVKEVIAATEKVLNKKINKQIGQRRPGDPPILLADASKATRELGWHPRYSLEEMILHAWEGIKEHE